RRLGEVGLAGSGWPPGGGEQAGAGALAASACDRAGSGGVGPGRWLGVAAVPAGRPGRRRTLPGRGLACGCSPTAGTCQELLAHQAWLGTFVSAEGAEPTNNTGERAERPGVL